MQTEQATQNPEKEQYTMKDFAGDVLDIIECVASAVFIVIIVFTFIVCVAKVEGNSMVPTLAEVLTILPVFSGMLFAISISFSRI